MSVNFLDDLRANASGRKIIVWGMDLTQMRCYYVLQYNNFDVCFMSNRPVTSLRGEKVFKLNILNKENVYCLVISNVENCRDILISKGFEDTRDFAVIKEEQIMRHDCMFDGVFLGKYTTGFNAFLDCLGKHSKHNCISNIGRYCSFNPKASMNGDHNSSGLTINQFFSRDINDLPESKTKPAVTYLKAYNKISIGNDVWIGANVFINASKVTSIGDGAVLGSNAVVLNDVPPFAIFAGVPGKVKKYRFSDVQIKTLLHEKWWDWDEETLAANVDCFNNINIFFERYPIPLQEVEKILL